MRKIVFLIGFLFLSVIAVNAQTVQPTPVPQDVVCSAMPESPSCPKILVTQQFLDDATKAFKLVVTQRDAIQKLLDERGLSAAERQAYETLKTALNEVIAIKDLSLKAKDELIAVYEKMLKLESDMIDKLIKQVNKPQTGIQKFFSTLKEVVLVVGGIALGRGLLY